MWIYQEAKQGDVEKILVEKSYLSSILSWFDTSIGQAFFHGTSLFESYLSSKRLWGDEQATREILESMRIMWPKYEQQIPAAYKPLYNILASLSEFEDDIISLLWFENPQRYLIILQNTSEERPNGGFFGSFATLKLVDGKIAPVELSDSYIIDRENDDVSLKWPEWLLEFLPHRDIHFVGANKIGFTYHDGDHIKRLYEKAYPGENIRGVIFLSTDVISQLIEWFDAYLRERQFTNAATDLIRGKNIFWKKEKYLQEVTQFVNQNKNELIKNVLIKLPDLLNQGLINVYLTDISVSWGSEGWGLASRLRRYNVTTRHDDQKAYFWWSNIAYNKIDNFVSKTITIRDSQWVIVRQTNNDIFEIGDLEKGYWRIDVEYKLDVPKEYISRMRDLEKKYNIVLGQREEHILGLRPTWWSRWVVYLPDSFAIYSVSWDVNANGIFTTPIPTSSAWYNTWIESNNWSAVVSLEVEKK